MWFAIAKITTAAKMPSLVLVLVLVFGGFSRQVDAGFIQVDQVLEFKRTVPAFELTLVPSVFFGILIDPPNPTRIVFGRNRELVLVPITLALFNIRPTITDVPQPVGQLASIDLHWFMAADIGSGIGPLPPGSNLFSAVIVGNSGTEFSASITPLLDLANLPSSSANDLSITWDLSELTQTTGSGGQQFFLASVTLPVSEIIVPEPSSIALFVTGAVGLIAGGLRRRRTKSHRFTVPCSFS